MNRAAIDMGLECGIDLLMLFNQRKSPKGFAHQHHLVMVTAACEILHLDGAVGEGLAEKVVEGLGCHGGVREMVCHTH